MGAAAITLSAGELKKITEAVDNVEVQGNRYPEQMQKMINR
jgi:hypothetical protein